MNIRSRIAFRYAYSKQNRHRSSVIRITIGLIICTAALNIVLSTMAALGSSQFESIIRYESYTYQMDGDEAYEECSKLGRSFLFAEIPAIVTTRSGNTFYTRLRGTDDPDYYEMLFGRLEEGGIALSYDSAYHSGTTLNSPLELVLLKKGSVATVVPVKKDSYASAMFQTPIAEFNQNTAICTLDTLLSFDEDAKIKTALITDMDEKTVMEKIGKFNPVSYRELNRSLYSALQFEKVMMYLVLSIMSIIVIFNLINSSRRLIDSKLRETAMLEAMGLTRRDMTVIFTEMNAIITAVSIAGGLIISCIVILVLPHLNPLFAHIHIAIDPVRMLFIALPILAISLVGTSVMAERRMRQDVMELLYQ